MDELTAHVVKDLRAQQAVLRRELLVRAEKLRAATAWSGSALNSYYVRWLHVRRVSRG